MMMVMAEEDKDKAKSLDFLRFQPKSAVIVIEGVVMRKEDDREVEDTGMKKEKSRKISESISKGSDDAKDMKKRKRRNREKTSSKKTKDSTVKLKSQRIKKYVGLRISSNIHALYTRSSPSTLCSAVKNLNKNRRDWVKAIGLGGLLNLEVSMIPAKLAYHVISNLDTEKMVIKVKNDYLNISLDEIHDVLKISKEGDDVFLRDFDKAKAAHWASSYNKKNDQVRVSDVVEKIIGTTEVDWDFKLNFLELFTAGMGTAEKSGTCSKQIIARVDEESNLAEINWCKYVQDCVRGCKNGWKPNSKLTFTGPLAFLTIFFCDRTRCSGVEVQRSKPVLKRWTNGLLKQREEIGCSRGFDDVEIETDLHWPEERDVEEQQEMNCEREISERTAAGPEQTREGEYESLAVNIERAIEEFQRQKAEIDSMFKKASLSCPLHPGIEEQKIRFKSLLEGKESSFVFKESSKEDGMLMLMLKQQPEGGAERHSDVDVKEERCYAGTGLKGQENEEEARVEKKL